MINIRTRVAKAFIVYSTSRIAAFMESKMLQYTSLSSKIYQCTLSKLKTHVFTLSNLLAFLSKHCADQKQHSNPFFSTKSDNDTWQTCVNLANEYLQTQIIGPGLTNHLVCSLHQS